MSQDTLTVIQKLAKVGVTAELLEERTGEVDVVLTIAQYEKLSDLLPDTKFLRIKAKKVQACVFLPSLEIAVINHAKAPRVSGMADVEILTKTAYYIDAPKAVNVVTYAEWSPDNKRGYINVNGVEIPIIQGRAEQYYDAPEDDETEWNPERPVYAVEVIAMEDGDVILSSYGVMNLVKRVIAFKQPITNE